MKECTLRIERGYPEENKWSCMLRNGQFEPTNENLKEVLEPYLSDVGHHSVQHVIALLLHTKQVTFSGPRERYAYRVKLLN